MIHTERLASGARLLLEPVDRTDTLCIGFWFLHGSRDEGSGQRGYSHLLEHMLFKGTARRSALSIAQEIDRVGGIINAFTEKETTCVYAIIPREHLRLAFDILSDMTVGSLLNEGELEKEKEVIVNEIRSVDDSPEEKGHDRYLLEMWGEHPLARKITGEVEEVQGAMRDQLAGFSREWLVPSNTVIAVAGNFDAQEARDLASAVFPSLDRHQTRAQDGAAMAAKGVIRPGQVQPGADLCRHLLSHRPRDPSLLHLARLQHGFRGVDELPPLSEAAGKPCPVLHRLFIPHVLFGHRDVDDLRKYHSGADAPLPPGAGQRAHATAPGASDAHGNRRRKEPSCRQHDSFP